MSTERRQPNVYRGRAGWWVDDFHVSGQPRDWEPTCWPTWELAISYAIRQVEGSK